ncbi:MAG: hypothetical protein WC284_08390 [Candidimonas sp.]
MPLSNSDFIAYKGVFTKTEFVVRNNDRKPINLNSKNLSIVITDVATMEPVISKELEIVDSEKGLVRLTIYPSEIENIYPNFFRFAVLIESSDGSQEVLYTDQNRQVRGFMEIREGAVPIPQRATVIECYPLDKLTPVSYGRYLYKSENLRYHTTSVPVKTIKNTEIMHTIAIYLNRFTGIVRVEASLVNEPPSDDHQWFGIDFDGLGTELIFNDSLGVEAYNFIGNFKWIRFQIEPDKVHNIGHIEKILLKS